MPDPVTLDAAIEVFARGFAFTRSIAHPYVATRVGPAWCLRDGPRAKGQLRNEEWIACGMAPSAIDHLARGNARGPFVICAIVPTGASDAVLRAGFKACRYRLIGTEALMVHPLRRIPRMVAPVAIQRVDTPEMAEKLKRVARQRQILPEHATTDLQAPLRAYVALQGERIVGWVRSIAVGDATWVSNMFVLSAYRRRGIGRSLLGTMLRDDRAAGAETSVLLASHAGAQLYPVVGYRTIGTLFLFTPQRA